ncbi:MAG: hypothetical protein G01um101491_48 [Parcubacteria group bacterium Gr01-1014_91]|nr:MAG: hypothetical protein G01um101491_48 [Parcubacteria group bacterium Gr01-1014_91]
MENKPSGKEDVASPSLESVEYLGLPEAIDLIRQRNQFVRENDLLGWDTGHFLQAQFDGRPKNYEGDVFKEIPQEGTAPKKMFKTSELDSLGKKVEDYIRMKTS